MQNENQIISDVYAAKENTEKADDLIKAYMPFIRSQASKFMAKACTEQDDEHSIAMMAFYEAILGYEKRRGAFLPYAGMIIRSRLIDYCRKEERHGGQISLNEESEDDDRSLLDTLPDEKNLFEENEEREATRQEIEELAKVMQDFGVSFSDVADNCPKQERTLKACAEAIRYAADNRHLLDELLRTKKLPLAELTEGAGVERKTLERHRKYILTMLLIQTNGYEIIRGHLRRVLSRKEGTIL